MTKNNKHCIGVAANASVRIENVLPAPCPPVSRTLEKIEVFKIIRNPISYIIFTNEGVKRFPNTEDLTEENILKLLE